MFFVSQIFIIIGYILFFISRFRKKKKNILLTDTISRICSIAGYCILHSVNSIEHILYGIVRNIVGQRLIKKDIKYRMYVFFIMLALLFIMYGVAFNGLSTMMFIISGVINLFAVFFLNEQGIRIGTSLAAICNIFAFIIVGSYASIIGESFCGIIGVISFVKNIKNPDLIRTEKS